MSELTPSANNSRLGNFEANKAAAERSKFEESLYGDAGQGDNPENYNDAARARVEEADAYERHMEEMAARPNYDPASPEGARERREGFIAHLDDLNSQDSPAYEKIRRAQMEAEAEEMLNRRIQDDERLRSMDNLSRRIHELNNSLNDGEISEKGLAILEKSQDILAKSLEEYSNDSDYDENFVNYMIDRDDEKAHRALLDSKTFKTRVVPSEEKGESLASPLTPESNEKALKKDDESLSDADRNPAEYNAAWHSVKVPAGTSSGDRPTYGYQREGEVLGYPGEKDTDWKGERKDDKKPADVAESPVPEPEPAVSDPTPEKTSEMPVSEDAERNPADSRKETESSEEVSSARPLMARRLRNRYTQLVNKYRRITPEDETPLTPERKKGLRKRRLIRGMGALALGVAVWAGVSGGSAPNENNTTSSATSQQEYDSSARDALVDNDRLGKTTEFNDAAARTAEKGEGWIQQLTDMGYTQDQINKALPEIRDSNNPEVREWVYTMADGNPGLAKPGSIPESVLQSIQDDLNK